MTKFDKDLLTEAEAITSPCDWDKVAILEELARSNEAKTILKEKRQYLYHKEEAQDNNI